ncbi:MAG: DHH family phosphoesterase, partial [Erysipelotrichaceae bacterium]|nr:DHH family phosphoesterase [Erysipelotrichaceae bacterium]
RDKLLAIKNEHFLIVGDYDCDGICSTAIIKRLFEHLGIGHNYYIPSRQKEGYGLSESIVETAVNNGFGALIAVDNGVAAKDALLKAKEAGIRVLILDHHEYMEGPQCYAFLHPQLLDKNYRKLSAGGLAYLFSTLFYRDDTSLVYGGIAVLGDMVGVLGYNRYLIRKTLEILNRGGIYQIDLLNGSGEYSFNSLSFNIIPKINSISRMEYNANILVRYLLSDKATCLKTVADINAVNDERKRLTEKTVRELSDQIDISEGIAVIVSDGIKEGICGLVANRLIRSLERPVIVFNSDNGILKGSGRSVEGFDLYRCLYAVKDLFESFGGHEKAIGLTMKEERLPELKEYIGSLNVRKEETLRDVYEADLADLDFELACKLDDLKPFGVDLSEPLILIRDVEHGPAQLMASKYPKYRLKSDLSAISFNTGHVNMDFRSLIGYLRKDNFYKDRASFIIEELSDI